MFTSSRCKGRRALARDTVVRLVALASSRDNQSLLAGTSVLSLASPTRLGKTDQVGDLLRRAA